MPRRRKKARSSSESKMRFDVLIWRIIVFSFYIASIALIIDTLYSLASPFDYPTSNLQDIVKVRSYTQRYDSVSCVRLVEAPMNFRQRYEVNIDMLGEIEFRFNQETYMGESLSPISPIVPYLQFLEVEKVHNFEAFLDGEKLDYHISEVEGVRFYKISGFNVTEVDKIYKLQILATVARTPVPALSVRTPRIFNENYAIHLGIPMVGYVPLHIDDTSDLSTLKVDFGVPYRRIVMEMSGWLDHFFPPEDEWETLEENGRVVALDFRFPLVQDFEQEGNIYLFSINFSENNNGTGIALYIVPDYQIPALFLLFLFSPFYIPLFEVMRKKSKQPKRKGRARLDRKKSHSRTKSLRHNIGQILFSTFELYSGPILGLLAIIFRTGISFALILYIAEITNPVLSLVIIFYPALFRFFFVRADF